MLLLTVLACSVVHHPTVPSAPPTADATLEDVLTPGPIELESVVSARWAVPLGGLLDLDDPHADHLEDRKTPIVLPVHVLTHPDAGVFVVDTGVSQDMVDGGHGPLRGMVVRNFVKDIEPLESLGSILERQSAPTGGVLLTHAHLDHIFGLPDVAPGVPVYVGPGELESHSFRNLVTRSTTAAAFDGHTVEELDFSAGIRLGDLDAVDLIGDGSLYALHVPGHTVGSLAYLARTTQGPALFVGDTSHTQFGWDHGVTPGRYTEDHDGNRESLTALKALADADPTVQVFVGHELDDAAVAQR